MRYAILLVPLLALLAACDDDGGPAPSASPSPIAATSARSPIPSRAPEPTTAVTAQDGIYVVRPDGTGLRGPFPGYRAGWSPDGSTLGIVSSHCDRTFSVVAEGSVEATQIASFPDLTGFISSFGWAPDSESILIAIQDPSGPNRVSLADADGRGEPQELFQSRSYSWSPDGGKVAYIDGSEMRVLNVLDRTSRTLVSNVTDLENPSWSRGGIAWSPDGSQIAYASSSGQLYSDIAIVGVDGTANANAVIPSGSSLGWTPDGRGVVYIRTEETGRPAVVARALAGQSEAVLGDGLLFDLSTDGNVVAVYDDPGDGRTEIEVVDLRNGPSHVVSGDTTPAGDTFALSPDGSQLIFNAEAPEHAGRRDLYIVNSDGTGLRKLVESARGIGRAEWSADGGSLAFVAVPPIGLQC